MSQRYSDYSSQILRRPSASENSPYRDDRSDTSRSRNGKRSRGDLSEDQVESPQKLARLDSGHHSVREKSQQQSSPFANASDQAPEEGFFDGPGHVVFVNERGKRCPAICFNQWFLSTFKLLAVFSSEIQERGRAIQDAQLNLEQIRSANQSAGIAEAQRIVEEAIRNQEDIEAAIPELDDARRRYEALKAEKQWSVVKLENSKDVALSILMEILTREKFLETPSSKPQEPAEHTGDHISTPVPAPERTVDNRFNKTQSSLASTRPRSPNETEGNLTPRKKAFREFERAENVFDFYKGEFDFMQEEYAQAIAAQRRRRREIYPDEPASATQTEIDLKDLQKKQYATRKLIEAEEAYDRAEQHAVALGLAEDPAEPSSLSWREQHIPLSPSMYPVNRPRIEAWMDSIPGSAVVDPKRQEEAESVEVDDWEAKSLELFETGSFVAWDVYRKKIDQWREMSNRLREAEAERPVPGNMRRNPRRRCRGTAAQGENRRSWS
ncbi:hypothetical protein IMSHALPRED_011104 [Imshaugia aleurites]|uniref:Uncharacterized protein n=1 Tax=Imshaugia aleurites TaxID=172621 RepID=A0A8H3J078_9LECA|nr:hypothetical protein IMSHALPRED_011104 [Imshaugia aleurites]